MGPSYRISQFSLEVSSKQQNEDRTDLLVLRKASLVDRDTENKQPSHEFQDVIATELSPSEKLSQFTKTSNSEMT